jgi:hypothetical protein
MSIRITDPNGVTTVLASLTTTQRDAITSPASGTLIYNSTTARPNYYDGSAWAAVPKVLTLSTATVGTPASLVETDLWSYSLPANYLTTGKGILVRVILTSAANANNKTATLYFGATTLKAHGPLASNAQTWLFEAVIYGTGAAAQLATTQGHVGATLMTTVTNTPAADSTGAITIRVTGTNGTANANDISVRSAVVFALN